MVLREKDQRRAEAMRRVCDGSITKSQAEALLHLGWRQVGSASGEIQG